MHDERREKSNAEDRGKRLGVEDQRVTFQSGPDVGTICGQGGHGVFNGEQMGEWTGQAFSAGSFADREIEKRFRTGYQLKDSFCMFESDKIS